MKFFLVTLSLLLAGCAANGAFEVPWSPAAAQTPILPLAQASPAGPVVAAGSAEFQRSYCELAKRGHGLPIYLDPAMKQRLVQTWGKEDAAKFLRPVARTNNAVRCFCATPEQKLKLRCK